MRLFIAIVALFSAFLFVGCNSEPAEADLQQDQQEMADQGTREGSSKPAAQVPTEGIDN